MKIYKYKLDVIKEPMLLSVTNALNQGLDNEIAKSLKEILSSLYEYLNGYNLTIGTEELVSRENSDKKTTWKEIGVYSNEIKSIDEIPDYDQIKSSIEMTGYILREAVIREKYIYKRGLM